MKRIRQFSFSGSVLAWILPLFLWSQAPERRITKEEYIQMYKDISIEEMVVYKIPASITLAQGILESAHGNSELARNANNHFGIKCHLEWDGKTYIMDDDARNECFRKYNDPYDSYRDHSLFLTTRERYAGLFKLDISDYRAWAHGLKKAGYATNPDYPQLLINIIEEFKLFGYDRMVTEEGYTYKPDQSTSREERFNPRNRNTTDFEEVSPGPAGRKIFLNNNIKFIYAKKGDTFFSIAQDFAIYTWQIYKYNDLDKNDPICKGQMIYLERKKNRSESTGYHVVQPGDSMYEISQQYGVKLKRLLKYNELVPGIEPEAGRKIWLHKPR
ncbi:MAG: glucosaminidase domain-containing protein [Bacteroidales bacterium]|nr:glucosaminidase domain-containing protein [Bacteroidales bacterium]